jgi:hypothetical protein
MPAKERKPPAMPHTLVRITIGDFAQWKAVFEEGAALRKAYGSKGLTAYRNSEKPNEVVIVAEYEDLDKARQMFQSAELREIMQRAGVSGPPEVSFLDEVGQYPA